MGSKHEGAWSIEVGTHTNSRATEVQGEKKKRKGKKEREKLRAMQDDAGGDINSQQEIADKSQRRKRVLDVSASHSDEIEITPEDGARKKRRRRRHKKGTGGADEE